MPHLVTLLPDGTPRTSPAWFSYDGEFLKFTATTSHIVYTTIATNPHVAVSIADPQYGMRYLEIRGVIEKIEPDPEATLLYAVGKKHNYEFAPQAVLPAPRVILWMRPTATTSFNGSK
ncbi:pyridoxamine 5'-phosphate oxidase-related, FMN-binding [Granulicella sibirica]|uniref:Pyridoxamine 5'-phosphate oxidase-related, FMN-binding n=1 Tax=Granulicella sibirica TaxID=2479048 RepID=A0A4Q0SYK7_9BACT|nr:pyridoxamine 5'-phosphate oxidase-related, FMN-binding [Granulicella sibirica]